MYAVGYHSLIVNLSLINCRPTSHVRYLALFTCSGVLKLDKIQTIKELLCVKYGLLSLPLFDVSQIDFMLESLCTF